MRTLHGVASWMIAVGCVTPGSFTAGANEAPAPAAPIAGGFAVVELFTSEGCSSCPPAEKLLGEIVADARKSDRRVYPLAFHVDYWDRLGWRDRFSHAAFTERQQQYARAFKSTQVYTPQIVVNGGTEFVGSDKKAAGKAIEAALTREPDVRIEVQMMAGKTRETLVGRYTLDHVPDGVLLNVALVERGLKTVVPRGENAGRRLTHENVVRWFTMTKADRSGEIKVTIPRDVVRQNASVILYVQEGGQGRVIGAAAADLK